MIFHHAFCTERSFEPSNTSVCGKGCLSDKEGKLQLTESDEVKGEGQQPQ